MVKVLEITLVKQNMTFEVDVSNKLEPVLGVNKRYISVTEQGGTDPIIQGFAAKILPVLQPIMQKLINDWMNQALQEPT